MTAVQENPVQDQRFVAPNVECGQTVLFYDRANTGAKPHIAFVTQPGERLIQVWVPTLGGGMRFTPRHVSDPKLSGTPELRDEGAWDFTDHDKAIVDRIVEWERRVKAIERAFSSEAIDGVRGVLIERARSLGLTGYSKIPNEKIIEMVEKAEAEIEAKRQAAIEAGKV